MVYGWLKLTTKNFYWYVSFSRCLFIDTIRCFWSLLYNLLHHNFLNVKGSKRLSPLVLVFLLSASNSPPFTLVWPEFHNCGNFKNLIHSKVWYKIKVSKIWWKFHATKSCSILFKLRIFLNKVSGKNMLKFQSNRTIFY